MTPAADVPPRRLPRWLSALLLGAVVLLLAFMAWSLVSSQRRVGAEHRRNFHALTVLAEQIAGWPPNLQTMARANLMRAQLLAPEPRAALAGWQARTNLFNPRLGEVTIHYAVVGKGAPCPFEKAARQPFSPSGEMTIEGKLPLSDILVYDLKKAGRLGTARTVPPTGAGAVIGLLNAKLPSGTRLGGDDERGLWTASVCFRTVVQLDEVVDLQGPSTPMVALLILDENKSVIAQLGSERLPISRQDEIVPASPITRSIFSLAAISNGKSPPADQQKDEIDQSFRPHQVDIAGTSYTAYSRPFSVPDTASGAQKRFYAVGLIPRRAISTDMGDLPPTTVTGFALLLAFLLALWPVVKLRLVGGGEAMSRLEIWAVGFGLVAAAALATISVRFAYDVMQARSTAALEAQHTAEAMSVRFGEELRRSVDAAGPSLPCIWYRGSELDVSPIESRQLADAPDDIATCRALATENRAIDSLPALESFFVADADGEQLPGTSILVWRKNAGGRPDIATRPYFRQAVAGRLLAADMGLGGWRQRADLPWTLSRRYAIQQVRSQADGISKTIVAFQAQQRQDNSRSGNPPVANPSVDAPVAATSVTVLPSLIAPALPPRLEFMVIDAADPEWPVVFHSDPSRTDLEKLRRELTSGAADDAVNRLMPAPSEGAALPPAGGKPDTDGTGRTAAFRETPCDAARANPTVCFAGFYGGRYRLFAGRALPGTSWVLLVHADVPQVDMPATQTVRRALWYMLAVALVIGSAIALERSVLRLRDRPRVAAWVRDVRGQLGLAEHDAAAVRRRFALAAALLLLAFLALLLDALVGRVELTMVPALAAGLVTFLYLLPIGRRTFDPRLSSGRAERSLSAILAALLILTGVVPASAIYSDAALFIRDRQASRDLASVSARLEHAYKARLDVVTSFDPAVQSDSATQNWIGGVCGSARENLFVGFGCPGSKARELMSRSWALNGARMTGDVFAPALVGCNADAACKGRVGEQSVSLVLQRPAPLSWLARSALFVLAALLALLLWLAMGTIMRGLFGIGLALEVMAFPQLPSTVGGEIQLRRDNWMMIVRPPLALERGLATRGMVIDLSGSATNTPAAPADQATADRSPVILTNLDLTVRNPKARQAALATLERIAAWHDRLRTDGQPRPALVMLTELAPLDRLLHAYEREADAAHRAGEARPSQSHEKMRWSRLLERFHTYFFPAIRRVDPLGFAAPAPARMAVEEVAFLPEQAIDALLEDPPEPPEPPPGRGYRLTAAEFCQVYTAPVHAWALGLNAPSTDAVVNYLGAMLVEHYEFIWAVSSWPERLAMHHLARGRLMNLETAFAIGSLIRRGIVVADPLPRLMNRSFGGFVLQTEKPASVRQWRRSLGGGAWQAARWPLAALIGVGVLAIVLLMVNAGETPAALLPLLVAAGPALLQTLGVIRR